MTMRRYTAIYAQMSSGRSETEGIQFSALSLALEHARAMAISAADLRVRNFNFYIIVSGALIAGYAKGPSWRWLTVLNVAGMFASALFFCLDIRGGGLYRRCAHQLMILEPLVWAQAGVPGWKPLPTDGSSRFLSHTWIYRSFFLVIGVCWMAALILTLIAK